MSQATQALGFERFGAFLALETPAGETRFHRTVELLPRGFESLYNCRDRCGLNPVTQRLKQSHSPIAWDQGFFVRHGQATLWEEIAAFDYRAGVGSALHMPGGRHHAFGVSRREALPVRESSRLALMAAVQLLGCHLHEASTRLSFPMTTGVPHLSERERECLRWTAAGKTAWEIGRILHLSERTVGVALGSATRTLGCVGKHQAALRAHSLGLLGS